MTRSVPVAPVPKRRGFTLIELLVVVAIIAVLISILLPSLGRAREQAKTVKCVANLKSVGGAMHMYFTENNNWFPFEKRNMGGLHGFYYGGHPGRQYQGDEWWGYTRATFRDTFAGRPFNRFLYQNLPTYDVPPTEPIFEQLRNQMNIYECPSDKGPVWNTTNDDNPDPTFYKSTFWICGSSYDFNYHFLLRWAREYGGNGTSEYKRRWLQRGNALLGRQLQKHASSFIILYEDAFDSAQWNNIPRRGWHQLWNRHSFLFLDGHSANMLTDTTQGNMGPGWKTTAGTKWFTNSKDPDYPLRDVVPVPGS